METKRVENLTSPPRWLKFLIVAIIGLSIVFRFANLDRKVYTYDEVRGLLRISGYSYGEFVEQVFTKDIQQPGDLIAAQDLQKYQHPSPDRNLKDSIKALSGNPEHPPLYYLLARFASQLFRDPVAARVLAVAISLLVFPCLYWLCQELFDSPTIGWIAMGIVAASPFHLMLSQEARQYSLWTVAILLSGATLLRALKSNTKKCWAIYAATVILGIYTHLFFCWVAISQGIYTLIRQGFRFNRTLVNYLMASGIAIVAFAPWIFVVVSQLHVVRKKTTWVTYLRVDPMTLFSVWLNNLKSIFVDFQTENLADSIVAFLILILATYSIYFIIRNTDIKIWSFVLLSILVTAITQAMPDLIWGGRRSVLSRYLTPSYVGIELSIAYLLATQATAISSTVWRRRAWQLLTILLISLGIASSAMAAQARDWWKGSSSISLRAASIINQSQQPTIVSDVDLMGVLPLSYSIDPNVKFKLFRKKQLEEIEKQSTLDPLAIERVPGDVFLYLPSQELIKIIQDRYSTRIQSILEPLDDDSTKGMYKIVK